MYSNTVVIWKIILFLRNCSPILSLFPSFSLPDVMCNLTDLIWRKGTSFEAMTGHTVPSSDGLLTEIFLSCKQMPDLCTVPKIISLSPLSLVADVTLGASELWLGTGTGAGGTDTLNFFFGRNPWLHGQQHLFLHFF